MTQTRQQVALLKIRVMCMCHSSLSCTGKKHRYASTNYYTIFLETDFILKRKKRFIVHSRYSASFSATLVVCQEPLTGLLDSWNKKTRQLGQLVFYKERMMHRMPHACSEYYFFRGLIFILFFLLLQTQRLRLKSFVNHQVRWSYFLLRVLPLKVPCSHISFLANSHQTPLYNRPSVNWPSDNWTSGILRVTEWKLCLPGTRPVSGFPHATFT